MFFRSERGIGRGEVAEGRIDAPLFAVAAVFCFIVVLLVHAVFGNLAYTIATGVSMLFFIITLLRVEWGIYLLTIAMMLAPEINAGAIGVASQRTLSLRYDDILIIVIFLGVLLKSAFEGRARLWIANPINPGIFLYYGVCLFSTMIALRTNLPAWDSRTAFFVMLKMLEFYMVFWMVGNALDRRDQIRNQLIVFFLVMMVVAAYGAASVGVANRVSSPFDVGGTEPNTLGGYLALCMLIALAVAIRSPYLRVRIMLFTVIATAIIPFLYTLSRASYLALLAGTLAIGIMSRRFWIVGTVAVVLLASGSLMPKEVRQRVNYTFQESGGVSVLVAGRDVGLTVDKSTYERIYVWQKVRYNLRQWPWLGGGVEWDRVLDSQYARVIIETGLFGLVTFLFLQWRVIRTMWEAYRWSEDWLIQGLGLGMTASAIALIVHSFGTISFLIVRIMEPFWLLAALVVIGRAIAIQNHLARHYAELEAKAEEEAPEGEGIPVEA